MIVCIDEKKHNACGISNCDQCSYHSGYYQCEKCKNNAKKFQSGSNYYYLNGVSKKNDTITECVNDFCAIDLGSTYYRHYVNDTATPLRLTNVSSVFYKDSDLAKK